MKQTKESPRTIRDVATLCRVSPATVSRVLNGKANPDLETTRRVAEHLEQLAYTRQRRVTATANILLLLGYEETVHSEHAILLQNELQHESAGYGMNLIPVCCGGKKRAVIGDMVREFNPAGVITVGGVAELDDTDAAGLAHVALTRHSWLHPDVSAVENDNLGGFVQAFDHLVRLGHRRIGLFLDAENTADNPQTHRLMYPAVYARAGLAFDPELVWHKTFGCNEHDPVIREAVAFWWSLPQPPTAIVLNGDCYAPGFYATLAARGLRIPEDVSIVGYADNDLARWLSPPLTSSRKHYRELAAEALRLLQLRIEKPDAPRQLSVIAPHLVVRGSTGPAPKSP